MMLSVVLSVASAVMVVGLGVDTTGVGVGRDAILDSFWGWQADSANYVFIS